VIDRRVELPAKARKAYDSMKANLCIEIAQGLEQKTITASSAAGKVAKLLQISSGFAYWRDEDEDPDLQQCEELHDVKFDAIESILAETNEPLVVVYFHRATAEQMRKRFKKRMVELDKAGKAQDAWNAGKVEILALQYRAGSTGLSLQHGGRNICLLAPTYAGDDYSQVIERLGPLRQMQSGYDRVVNVFRIIANNTEDERVFAVAEGKIDTETAITRMIQGA